MRSFRPPHWNHSHWKKAWGNCKASWNKWRMSRAGSPNSKSDSSGSPSEKVYSPLTTHWTTAFLNRATTLGLMLVLCVLMSAWGGALIYQVRQRSNIPATFQHPMPHGIPSPLILEEGQKELAWLTNYSLDSPNVVNGNELLLVTSSFRASREEALTEGREFLASQILQKHHQQLGNRGVFHIPTSDLITYYPTHEGFLEKTITAGQFTSPMYRAYLLATISPAALERLSSRQQELLHFENARLLLWTISLIILTLISLVIVFRIDLATQGRRRWVGNLVACLILLIAGGGTIAAGLLL